MKTCPHCDQALSPLTYEGVAIDRCDRCGGEWLDGDKLKQILAADRAQPEPSAEVEAMKRQRLQGVPLVAVKKQLHCPVCQQVMETFNYGGDSGIILDKCRQCGGIWLDAGALDKVRHFIEAADEVASEDWARFGADVREVENREELRAHEDMRRTVTPGGSALVNRVLDL